MRSVAAVIALVACVHAGLWALAEVRLNAPNVQNQLASVSYSPYTRSQHPDNGDRPTAEGYARKLASIAPIDERIQVLGPAEAPLAVIKGRYRFRLLLKSARGFDLSDYVRQWLGSAPRPKGNLKLEVDVDPQSFL